MTGVRVPVREGERSRALELLLVAGRVGSVLASLGPSLSLGGVVLTCPWWTCLIKI